MCGWADHSSGSPCLSNTVFGSVPYLPNPYYKTFSLFPPPFGTFFQVHPKNKETTDFLRGFFTTLITRNIRLINYNLFFYKNQIILNLFTINLHL